MFEVLNIVYKLFGFVFLQIETGRILAKETQRKNCFSHRCKTQLLIISGPRIRHQNSKRHLLGSLLAGRLEREHAFVGEVRTLVLSLIREWEAFDERSRWLSLGVQEEVAMVVELQLFVPCITISVETINKQDAITDLHLTFKAEVQVDLFVVLPELTLTIRPLTCLFVLEVVHLPVNTVDWDILLPKIVRDKIYLLYASAEILEFHVPREQNYLEVSSKVADTLDGADADPHSHWGVIG